MRITLADVERLPGSRFWPDNSVLWMHIPQPAHSREDGCIEIESPFTLAGWCDTMPDHLMYGRDGHVGLMFWHPEYEYVWQHYPLFDDDDRKSAVFVQDDNAGQVT